MSERESNPRFAIGKVVSNKSKDTIVVMVERKVKHPKYGKYQKKSTKLHAHCTEETKLGDIVRIQESKPISKMKTWQFIEKVTSAV